MLMLRADVLNRAGAVERAHAFEELISRVAKVQQNTYIYMHTREDTLDHRICEQCPQYTFASIAAALQLSVSRPPIAEYGTRKERLASSSAPSWQSVSGQLGKSTFSGVEW